jgi:glycosyltransferase involved in cell wall biosynthesis
MAFRSGIEFSCQFRLIMNILILNWRDVGHPKAGGAELVTMEHAKAWVRAGHHVTWLTGWYGGMKNEVIEGVRIARRAGTLTIYPYAMMYVLWNGRKFDVIVDEAHGFPFFSPLFTQTPVVMFIHEIAGEIWDYMYRFPKNVIGKFLEKEFFRLYRNCLFWTDAPSTISELSIHGIPVGQCTAIPCPIVKNAGKPQSFKKESNPTYIFVSRVVRMKGIEEVIKAFSLIYRTQQSSKLWIIGKGEPEYIRELQQMIHEYGVNKLVHFFGLVNEDKKFEYMGRAHILLHASVKEGWGLVVLEAASVGTPSIVYNVPGLRDVVKHNKTGVVLTDNSPHEMAREAMRLFIDKRRYVLYQTNGKIWVNSLKWDNVTKQSSDLLQQAINKIKSYKEK